MTQTLYNLIIYAILLHFVLNNNPHIVLVEEERPIVEKLPPVVVPKEGRFRYIQVRLGDKFFVRGDNYWKETLFLDREFKLLFKIDNNFTPNLEPDFGFIKKKNGKSSLCFEVTEYSNELLKSD